MVGDLIGSMLDALAEGEDPGVVLCLEDARAARYQATFTEDGEDVCLEAAQRFVSQNSAGVDNGAVGPIERYAIAYTGCVNLDGSYEDAIIVSFYEHGLETGFSAYVLYANAGAGDGFMWSDPEPAGEEPALI